MLTMQDALARLLAYWTARYGRRVPMAVKRGVADAVRRLWTERAALKYDGGSRNWRPCCWACVHNGRAGQA